VGDGERYVSGALLIWGGPEQKEIHHQQVQIGAESPAANRIPWIKKEETV